MQALFERAAIKARRSKKVEKKFLTNETECAKMLKFRVEEILPMKPGAKPVKIAGCTL